MQAYNLLVTFHHNQKGHAEQEVRDRMKDLGAYVERLDLCDVEGVFLVQVGGDARVMVSQLKRMCHEDPGQFFYTYHWVPIERWVPSRMEDLRSAVIEMGKGMSAQETWMMHLHKRHFQEHHDDVVAYLTDPLDKGPVDLEDPERIIAVEILGEDAGISLLNRHELLDVNKVKAASEMAML